MTPLDPIYFLRNICQYRFKKKICIKIPKNYDLENFICIYTKNIVNVAMRMEEAFYTISTYLYNKNVLENAQIARNETESKITHIEGRSNIYNHESALFS